MVILRDSPYFFVPCLGWCPMMIQTKHRGKVQVDEVLEVLDDDGKELSDDKEGLAIPRRRFRSTRLGKEGWETWTFN